MDEVSDRRRHRWAAGNAALTTAVIVLIEPSRLSDRPALTAVAVLFTCYVLAFCFWQLVHWVTGGRYMTWTKSR